MDRAISSAKLRPATIMRMLLRWAIAQREGIRLFRYRQYSHTSIVMLGEMSMTFMNEDIIMSASSTTTATPSALAATLMSTTYQDCPAFRGCRRRERHGVRHSAPPIYLRRQYSCLYFMFAHILQLPSNDHDLQDAKFVPAFAGRAFLLT